MPSLLEPSRSFSAATPPRSRLVSPEPRGDGGKVTMQTRIAVRDKTPHRFQVVPLREVLRFPKSEAEDTRRTSKTRTSRIAVQAVDGTKQRNSLTRCSKKDSKKLFLQDRDLNIDITPTGRPLEANPVVLSETDHQSILQQQHLDRNCPDSAHGYSYSLDQYSFQLPPWKASISLDNPEPKISEAPTLSSTDLNKRLPLGLNQRAETLPEIAEPCMKASSLNTQSYEDCGRNSLADDRDYGDYVVGAPDRPRCASQELYGYYQRRKRHAIYACSDLATLVVGPDTASKHSPPTPEQCGDTDPAPSLDCFDDQACASDGSGSSAPYAQPSPVRPLNLVRNSLSPSKDNASGDLVYPYIIQELLKEVEEALWSWHAGSYSSS